MKKYYNEDDDIVDDIVNEINQGFSDDSDEPGEIDMTITLTLEDGSELECDVILMFEINENGQNYVALYPSSGEPDEIYLFRCSEFDGSEEDIEIEEIDDEDEYKMVCETFDTIMEDDEWNDLMNDDDDED